MYVLHQCTRHLERSSIEKRKNVTTSEKEERERYIEKAIAMTSSRRLSREV